MSEALLSFQTKTYVIYNPCQIRAGCGFLPRQGVEEHQLSQVREGEARAREMVGWSKEPTQRNVSFLITHF